jgi:uncharacterized integral membrane protein
MASPSKRQKIAWIVGALVTVLGFILVVVGTATPVTFGWFASAPESNTESFPGDLVVLRRSTVAGAALLTSGLVTLALLVGMHVGSRRTRDTGRP